MLAGCSSTLLSPRHRLRTETSAQFQPCHFPSMSTQRLDLPCSYAPKDTSRSQQIRPVSLSVERPIEAKTSLKQNIRLPPLATTAETTPFTEGRRERRNEAWGDKGKSLKRVAEQGGSFDEESCLNRAKRKRGSGDSPEEAHNPSFRQLGGGNFWYHPSFEVPPSSTPHQLPFSLSCSGEEERVCFVPSDVFSRPLSSNAWVESVVNQIADLGEKNVETSRHRPVKEASGSSTSSGSRGLAVNLNEDTSELEIGGDVSRPPNPNEAAQVVAGDDDNRGEDDEFEIISLLMACVESICSKNFAGINHFVAKLGDLASPRGSTISRLAAYFTEALALRVSRLWPHVFHIATPRELERVDEDSGSALRLLNQASPIPKFTQFTANEILLRALEGKDRVHIIDFDIKQGLQWPSLFQSLASSSSPPTHVRITGIGECKQELIETGDRLAGFAEVFNLPFEFHPVVDRLEDVRLWMLHVKERESVAVNCMFQLHKMLYDDSQGVLRDFLGLIQSTNPTIVVIGEQEADHNDLSLETRLSNSLKYYAAIFDSIDSCLPLDDSPARIRIEEMFAREIRNIVACEGRDRLERHESFGKWRNLMERGGFRCMGIGDREVLQSQMLLKMYSCDKYRVERQAAALTLSWVDQPLCTVSAWAPICVAGSSSSYSRPS